MQKHVVFRVVNILSFVIWLMEGLPTLLFVEISGLVILCGSTLPWRCISWQCTACPTTLV